MLFWNLSPILVLEQFMCWGFEAFQGFIVLEKEKGVLSPAVFSIKAKSSLLGAYLSEEGPAMATDHIVIIDRFMCSRDSQKSHYTLPSSC